MESSNNQTTYLVVDGENIDATLGLSVLDRRPNPEERPRWDRVLAYCDELSSADATEGEGNEARALFFLNATSGHMPMGFVQALMAMDYRPLPLAGSGDPEEKVVDIGIQRTLEAIALRVEAGQGAQSSRQAPGPGLVTITAACSAPGSRSR